MGVYARCVLPRLTDLAIRNGALRAERASIVPRAEGRVLEVGVGSGLNIPFYRAAVRRLYALDPSAELLRMARLKTDQVPFPVDFLQHSAEAIPVVAGTFDCVVTTWTPCTIPDPVLAVVRMRRVLRSDGRLIWVEHGRSPEPRIARWQDGLTPLWRRITGGCHLNRPIDQLLMRAGFEVIEMKAGYIAGLRVGTFVYRGIARPARSTFKAPPAEPGSRPLTIGACGDA